LESCRSVSGGHGMRRYTPVDAHSKSATTASRNEPMTNETDSVPGASRAPTTIAIDHDDYHAKLVGRTPDGRQFFLTTPFEPGRPGVPGCEFVALYIFDPAGNLVEAKIDQL